MVELAIAFKVTGVAGKVRVRVDMMIWVCPGRTIPRGVEVTKKVMSARSGVIIMSWVYLGGH